MLRITRSEFLEALCGIEECGAASIKNVLPQGRRKSLLRELRHYQFEKRAEIYGKYNTYQAFEAVSHFPRESRFNWVRDLLQARFNALFALCFPDELTHQIAFNDLVVQRYQPAPLGISPHRDGKKYKNLIALFVLEGHGRFCVCDDRDGTNPRSLSNEPGDLILLGAGSLLGKDYQPFHFVDNIVSQRVSFALRQR